MTTTVNATLPQDDTYVKMVEYATNLKLTECRVGKAEAVPILPAIFADTFFRTLLHLSLKFTS